MEREIMFCANWGFSYPYHQPEQEEIDLAEEELRRRLVDYIQKNAVVARHIEKDHGIDCLTVRLKIPSGIDQGRIEENLREIYRILYPQASRETVAELKHYLGEIWEEIFGEGGKPRWMT